MAKDNSQPKSHVKQSPKKKLRGKKGMDEQKIIFSNRFEKEKFEDYKTDLETGSSITPDYYGS
ncbi:MAG: hypothetical protein ACLR0U_04085 [Enterocloster clostridioformis]